MITINTLDSAIFEAERFIKKAKEAKESAERNQRHGYPDCQIWGKEAAAARRSSMDLSNELVPLRKYNEGKYL